MGNCSSGMISDNEIFIIKIKLYVLFPDVLMTETINKCPQNIKKEAKDYIQSMLFRNQLSNDINRFIHSTPRYMLLNINTIVFDEELSEIKIYCIINLINKSYKYIPTFTEFKELVKQSILDGLNDKGYPSKTFKKYFGITDKDYKITFQENDILIQWY